MDTIEVIREFLGWCSVINIVLLMFSAILISVIRKTAARLHGKMFNLDENFLSQAYFQYLGQYKIAIIVFNIVPYFALKIMW
ncbi:MAG: hypothetical protein KAJ14_04555 [Candidatus Omnitrophica bacterium]|nr:hypothetical protein [Candidatus Omnitrophota bacterium]